MTPGTVWLASYPRSGNTWFLIFLAYLLNPDRSTEGFDRLPMLGPIASSRAAFEDSLGVPSALLTASEAERLRPAADNARACGRTVSPPLRKVHDAYTTLDDGRPLLGARPEVAAIYILRDPCDVAVSLTGYYRVSLEEAVSRMCDPAATLAGNRAGPAAHFPQRLLSWEGHARSWLEAPLDLHLLRYEDMQGDPVASFGGAIRFLGLEHDDRDIEAALAASCFERLRSREQESLPRAAPLTFGKGRVGEGRKLLSKGRRWQLEAMRERIEQSIAAKIAA